MKKILVIMLLISSPVFASLSTQDEVYLKALKVYDASVSALQAKQNEKNQALKQIEDNAQVSLKTTSASFDSQIDALKAQVDSAKTTLEASK